jgi:hypothetical protein
VGGGAQASGGGGGVLDLDGAPGRAAARYAAVVRLAGRALYFCTGPDERKAKNLVRNPHCILTAGCNALDEGLDVVVEGDAVRVTDEARLGRVADAYLSKYGSDWRFAVRDGTFYHDPGSLRETDTGAAWVYEVSPKKVFGFGKGEPFSQTRWRF